MQLSRDHKIAGLMEFAIGLPLNIALFCALYFWLLPDYAGLESAAERLVFVFKCSALPGATLLFGLWAVALGRGTSLAINPLKGLESPTLQIHLRYFQNTLEQVVLFVVSAAALSPFLNSGNSKIIAAAAILFFINRLVFWLGYLKHPNFRGLGLPGTLYPVTLMMLAALYFASRYIITGQ